MPARARRHRGRGVLRIGIASLAGLALAPSAWHGAKALVGGHVLPADKTVEEDSESVTKEGVGFLDVRFVELQVESSPAKVAKLFVPVAPQVAQWLTETSDLLFGYRLQRSLTGRPQIHVKISGSPMKVGNMTAEGIEAAIELPDGAVLEACQVGVVRVSADLEPLAQLGPIRAVLLVCPLQPSSGQMTVLARLLALLQGGHPMRWLLLPWLMLLFPFILGSTIGPMALLGGAALTLASIACLSFLIAILIVLVQRRCIHWTRRWRRLWRLRKLRRSPVKVQSAFGDGGPCCICLAELDGTEAVIALLPCRHALHSECYANWVSADSYPSYHLICPVCRRRADAIGTLSSQEPQV